MDKDEPKDSIHRRWTETSFDGEPGHSPPIVPPHWHKHHDEYMEVVHGRVEFTLDGKSSIYMPENYTLFIPRLHVHSVRFLEGEAAMFTEKTDPPGDFKKDFFEDLLDDGYLSMLTAWRAFYNGDTYLALPGGLKILDQAVTLSLGYISAYLFPQKHKGMLGESVQKQAVQAKL